MGKRSLVAQILKETSAAAATHHVPLTTLVRFGQVIVLLPVWVILVARVDSR